MNGPDLGPPRRAGAAGGPPLFPGGGEAGIPEINPEIERWPTAWLIAGASVELAINAWAMLFVRRLVPCDRAPRVRRLLQPLQAAMVALPVAFIAAVLAGALRLASWLAAAFFFAGLVCAPMMRVWLRSGVAPVPSRALYARCGVTRAEHVALDSVNWLAIVGVVIKVCGLLASLWVALFSSFR